VILIYKINNLSESHHSNHMTIFPLQPLHGGWKKTFVNKVPLSMAPRRVFIFLFNYIPIPSSQPQKKCLNFQSQQCLPSQRSDDEHRRFWATILIFGKSMWWNPY